MDKEKLQEFLKWLPTKYKEFENKSVEDIANSLNEMTKSEKGQQTLQSLWKEFENSGSESAMFKKGGKLEQLVKMKKGGKKCKCGCEIIQRKADGGTIETCACGCKYSRSMQTGGEIPVQPTTWFDRRIGTRYRTTPIQNGAVAQLLTGNNTMHRVIERPAGGYTNKTWQIIKNYGTPKADTTYVSPRGNTFTPQQAPTWNSTFNAIFGKKKK